MKRKIISKKPGWNRQVHCVLKYQDGTQIESVLDESEVLRLELEEKLEMLIPVKPTLEEILKNLDHLLQSKYEEAMYNSSIDD